MGHTNWDKDAYVRLIAALLAAHPELKPNFSKMAAILGDGHTYDSVQSRFRGIQKLAKEMNVGLSSSSSSNLCSLSNPTTPRKPRTKTAQGVISGRISKKSSPKKHDQVSSTSPEEDLLTSFHDASEGSSHGDLLYGLGDRSDFHPALDSFHSLDHVDLGGDFEGTELVGHSFNTY